MLNLIKKVQIFPKFSARFARKSYFLIIFFSNSLQSFGIFKHLFTYILINFLTKPTSINAFIYLAFQISITLYKQSNYT